MRSLFYSRYLNHATAIACALPLFAFTARAAEWRLFRSSDQMTGGEVLNATIDADNYGLLLTARCWGRNNEGEIPRIVVIVGISDAWHYAFGRPEKLVFKLLDSYGQSKTFEYKTIIQYSSYHSYLNEEYSIDANDVYNTKKFSIIIGDRNSNKPQEFVFTVTDRTALLELLSCASH